MACVQLRGGSARQRWAGGLRVAAQVCPDVVQAGWGLKMRASAGTDRTGAARAATRASLTEHIGMTHLEHDPVLQEKRRA